MLSGAKNRIRCAMVVRPSWSSHPQNALLRAAMCAMNRACWAAGTVLSPGGTRDSPTSRITMVRTASSVRSIATTV